MRTTEEAEAFEARERWVRGLLRGWMWLQMLGMGGRLLFGVSLLTWWSTELFVGWAAMVGWGAFQIVACRAFLGPRRRRWPVVVLGVVQAMGGVLAPTAMLVLIVTGDFVIFELLIPVIGLPFGIGWAVAWGLVVRQVRASPPGPSAPGEGG